MGWKSTIKLTRDEALTLIFDRLNSSNIPNDNLGTILESMGYGDDVDLKYYGYNFTIVDKEADKIY